LSAHQQRFDRLMMAEKFHLPDLTLVGVAETEARPNNEMTGKPN
tara:strand:+ start:371 stop:502 length:132 start_codon:yes stop_codon:yes gene_type:complete